MVGVEAEVEAQAVVAVAVAVPVGVEAVVGVEAQAEVGVRWLRPPLLFDRLNKHRPGPPPARWAAPRY